MNKKLETVEPNLVINSSYYISENDKTPYLEISNSEKIPISNLNILFMVSPDNPSEKSGVFIVEDYKGIEIYKNQIIQIPLTKSSKNLYHSIIFIYQNPVSQKMHSCGLNINFSNKNEIFPIGMDFTREAFKNKKSPISIEQYWNFLDSLNKKIEPIDKVKEKLELSIKNCD